MHMCAIKYSPIDVIICEKNVDLSFFRIFDIVSIHIDIFDIAISEAVLRQHFSLQSFWN